MVGGQLVRGAINAAGELGFLPFGADPFDPESLRTGAFERVVASIGIMERYVRRPAPSRVPVIFERADGGRCGGSDSSTKRRDIWRAASARCGDRQPGKGHPGRIDRPAARD